MSNKPKIYAPCKAGCNWETVHKSDFEASASHIRQNIDEGGICYLQKGKEYKIFAPKDNSNQFTCSVVFAYSAGGTAKTHTIAHTNGDKYAESLVFRLLEATATTSTITLVYEMAGVRYTETISGSSLSLLTENDIYVSGADSVLMFNADATIVAKDGITPKLRINEETLFWEISYDDGETWASLGVKASGGSSIEVDKTLSVEGQAADAKAVGDKLETKLDKAGPSEYGFRRFYTCKANGETEMLSQATTASTSIVGRVPSYFSARKSLDGLIPPGFLITNTPKQPAHAANKDYVDRVASSKYYEHNITVAMSGTYGYDTSITLTLKFKFKINSKSAISYTRQQIEKYFASVGDFVEVNGFLHKVQDNGVYYENIAYSVNWIKANTFVSTSFSGGTITCRYIKEDGTIKEYPWYWRDAPEILTVTDKVLDTSTI